MPSRAPRGRRLPGSVLPRTAGPARDGLATKVVATKEAASSSPAQDRPPRPANRKDVDDEVLRLRDSGVSYSAVAGQLGLSRAVDAQAGFVRALRRRPDEERAQLTVRESARLDALEVRVRSRDADEPEKMNRRLGALERLREAIK